MAQTSGFKLRGDGPGALRTRRFLTLLAVWTPLCLMAQPASVEIVAVSGASGHMQGLLSSGSNSITGSVDIIVGQPFVNSAPLAGGGMRVDLGYWSQLLRTPGTPEITASYQIYPDRVNLQWQYDPNDPPGTANHYVYRNRTTNPNPIVELVAGDHNYLDTDLPAGQQYVYTVRGSNSIQSANTFQPFVDAGEAIGATSSDGSVSGFIETTLGSPIPGAEVRAFNSTGTGPAWGRAIFLDGVDDGVAIPDYEALNFFDQALMPNATLELWLQPDQTGNQTIMSKGNDWSLELDTQDLNYLSLTLAGSQVLSTDHVPEVDDDQALAVGEWNHIALVREDAELRLYLNGRLARVNNGQITTTLASVPAGADSLVLGLDLSEAAGYRGFMDELRIWKSLRDEMFMEPYEDLDGDGEYDSGEFFTDINGDGVWGESDSTAILRDHDRLFFYRSEGVVIEPDLAACFHMDRGEGVTLVNSVSLDHSGSLQGTWSNTQSPAFPSAFTDAEGAYQIRNLNFGSGTTFRIIAAKTYHEFDPPYTLVNLNQTNPTNYAVDFTVTNMISISGYVYYDTRFTEGNLCGEPDVSIWVNGEFRGTRTNADGFFLLEIEPGRTLTIQPKKAGRDVFHFAPQTKTFFAVVSPQNQNFVDSKVRTLRGSVTGGACELPLGPAGIATVTVTTQSYCFQRDTTVDASGIFEFNNLPPRAYQITVAMDLMEPNIPNLTEMNTYFVNNGQTIDLEDSFSPLDSAWLTDVDEVKFNWRAPLSLSVEGWNINALGDVGYEQNEFDTLDIYVYEQYYSSARCPLDTGTVHIKDWLSDRYVDGDPESDSLIYTISSPDLDPGVPSFRFPILPGLPNLVPFYRKNLQVEASDISGVRSVVEMYQAVVTGHFPRNVDFATTAPGIPYMILRRPPGDGSSASFQEVSSTSLGFGMSMSYSSSAEQSQKVKLGVETEINTAPMGVGTSFDMKTEMTAEAGFKVTAALRSSTSMAMTTTTSTAYTTPTSASLMGMRGTVFVGGALNLLYGTTDVLAIHDGEYTITTEALFLPDGFATTFIYTRGYIEDILLPELYSLLPTDEDLEIDIERWEDILEYEDSLRLATAVEDNYSFSGGGQSITVGHSNTTNGSLTLGAQLTLDAYYANSLGLEVAGFGASGQVKVSTSLTMGAEISAGFSNSSSTSFTLSDDDASDDYTVDVGTDPVYGTPVFDVLAGNSSCPYEEWVNEDGEVVTTPIDEPSMQWMTPNTVLNVHPDGIAQLKIGLQNLADFAGSRTYYLAYLGASNVHGAEILINGIPADEENPIAFEMEYLDADSALITVARPPGSDIYEFDDLRIKFAPPCEFSHGSITDGYSASFNVHFARPCTEAEIYQPSENWVLNQETGDTLTIVIQEYDLDQSYFDDLLVQYSRLGESNWFGVDTLNADTLREYGYLYSQLFWDTFPIMDGIYDIRLMSRCLDGALNNIMPPLRGTIDRVSPAILGLPQPVDGVLNFNDEIAVNFTEPIDPQSVTPINVVIHDQTSDVIITDFDLAVSENRITVTPLVANRFIENHRLEVTINGVRDLFGNPAEELQWHFDVDRNPVAWGTSSIEHLAFQGEINTLSIELNNTGSQAEDFQLSGTPGMEITPLPEWLTAFPAAGSLNPGGTFDITLDIDPYLNDGEYNVTIYAVTAEGYEPLHLQIVSLCPYPEWSFTPQDYEFSMSVTGRLYIQGSVSQDVYNRAAAFVDGECRGWAQLQYVPDLDDYLVFLTAYSNVASGETVDLHIWSRTACSEYWRIEPAFAFEANAIHGSPSNPVLLDANGEIGEGMPLNSGFSWISLHLESTDMSVTTTLADVAAEPGDRIISQSGYAQYSAEEGWVGTLGELTNHAMYQLDLELGQELVHVGYPVLPDTVAISIASGWNWISYLPHENLHVDAALAALPASTDDLVKSQTQFAQYVDGLGWIGSLDRMFPTQGYMLTSQTGGILTYPPPTRETNIQLELEPDSLVQLPWAAVESGAYPYTMSMTLLLESDTLGINNPHDAVAAFVDDELRGVARPVWIPTLNAYRIFLTIEGNSGEAISLVIWDSDADIEYRSNEHYEFAVNGIIGSPLHPDILTRAPLGIGDKGYIPEDYSLSPAFPNPFNPSTQLGFGLPEDGRVNIRVYNLLGQLVQTLVDDNLTAGYRFVTWYGRDEYMRVVGSGVYIIVMEATGFRDVRKVVLLH